LKTNEEFRASVYARAQLEQRRIAARRQKARSASLSAAMLLLVAIVAVPLAINLRGEVDPTVPPVTNEVRNAVNPAALGARMVVLVGTQAVVLENEAQQKQFVDSYRAAMNLSGEEGAPFPAADTAREIHSTDELMEFLAEMPDAAQAMRLDYNEAFFADNDLYAMPMGLAPQPETTAPPVMSITGPATESSAEASVVATTIPDGVSPSDANAPPVPAEAEPTTGEDSSTAPVDFPPGDLLNSADVTVLLLVPVNKG